MATTTKQDQEFLYDVVGTALLESSIEWIKNNLSPDQVFSEKDLKEWANNGEVDDIFTTDELTYWAENNGFVKDTE